ncbi:uncharacterized [Tachysurus ichikawai]
MVRIRNADRLRGKTVPEMVFNMACPLPGSHETSLTSQSLEHGVYLKSVLNSAQGCNSRHTPGSEATRSVEPWCRPINPLARLRQPSPSPRHCLARRHPYLLNSGVISSPAGLPHMGSFELPPMIRLTMELIGYLLNRS